MSRLLDIPKTALVTWVLWLASAGCAADPQAVPACTAMVPGDIVLSELMVNPAGADSGFEWIELYNPTSSPILLDRMVLEVFGASRQTRHDLANAQEIAAGQYAVLGQDKVAFAHYSYGSFTLPNEGGRVRLSCRGHVLDEVAYGNAQGAASPSDGVALQVDGGLAPDALTNDQSERWCDAATLYDESNRGTPGAANEVCGVHTCVADAGARATVSPQPATVYVSEVFANPQGDDANREWIELYVGASLDLNGLSIAQQSGDKTRTWTLQTQSCLAFDEGDLVVVGFVAAGEAFDPGTHADALVEGSSLYNTASTLTLTHAGILIDVAQLPEAVSGKSATLDVDNPSDASRNDDQTRFCPGQSKGLFGSAEEQGTPGLVNDFCGHGCLDEQGARQLDSPAPGDLVITEIFSDPDGADGRRDWLELRVLATRPIDLNGLEISNASASGASQTWKLDDAPCLRVQPSAWVVLAGEAAQAIDGVESLAQLRGGRSTLFVAQNGHIALSHGGVLLDETTYGAVESGRSWALDAAGAWCSAAASAGESNAPCP